MSKKHFELIAALIREVRSLDDAVNRPDVQGALTVLVLRMCNEFAVLNDKFNRERFIAACEI